MSKNYQNIDLEPILSKIYFNASSRIKADKNIFFLIDLNNLKVLKIFKDPNYLNTIEPNYYLTLYFCPIYKGNLIYLGDSGSKGLPFKSFVNQILRNLSETRNNYVEWKPSVGLDRSI